MKYIALVMLLTTTGIKILAQTNPLHTKDLKLQEKWVKEQWKKMNLEEKIGQLFMIPAYSNKDAKHTLEIKKYIAKYHIGGLIFMQGTPEKQASLCNIYQKESKVPLMIGFDGEWGLSMRLKNSFKYPWNMTLGAVQNPLLIEEFGRNVGKHCKRIGIHVNFAPVVDINTNPANPIIGNRSFGEDKKNVTQRAIAFTKGLQSNGVLATAKHFPGHGDTNTDSHKTLPRLLFSLPRLDSIELYPYRQMFPKKLAGVMVAHLDIPSLVHKKGTPSSLSYDVVTKLLQKKMNFKGLIFTDALNMKGVIKSDNTKPGAIELAAFLAGSDILLFSKNVPAAIATLKKAWKQKKFTMKRLEQSVKKILKAKYWAGLHHYTPIKEKHIQKNINTIEDKLLFRKLMEEAITLVKNDNHILPITFLEKEKIAYVKIGDEQEDTAFYNSLNLYTKVDYFSDKIPKLLEKLKPYSKVILGYYKSNKSPWEDYKMSASDLKNIQNISDKHTAILHIFTSPYALLQVKDFKNIEAVVTTYQNNIEAQQLAAQKIFGAMGYKGKLPVSIRPFFKVNTGVITEPLLRLSYGIPESVGISSKKLSKIDSVLQRVVQQKMAPGGQILVARYGKVIYHKPFGYFTYEKKQKVTHNNIYDLASITKILGGLPMIMKSQEMGLLSLEDTLGDLLPYLKGSNKEDILLKNALSHYAGLEPWIPFYKETIDTHTATPLPSLYSKTKNSDYTFQVADSLFLKNTFSQTLYQRIAEIPNRKKKEYKYSGLIFYLMNKYFQDQCGKNLSELNHQQFYAPLGATTLGYNPLNRFTKNRIVPSEIDDYFRHQELQGYVHDMGAAMTHGINANAGLFSNANDVAKMMQMYLQQGYYGGKQYFLPKTIATFNKRYFEKEMVRRGLVFDKPSLDTNISASSKYASPESFGHTGFTGTYTWADPTKGILFVFLSNRTYPNMRNNSLGEKNIRTTIHDLIYEAITDHF